MLKVDMPSHVGGAMTEHEKNQYYAGKKAEMQKKYGANVANFCTKYNCDLGVGFDMLLFNAKCLAKGFKSDLISGGGTVNVPELIKDYEELTKYVEWKI